MVSQLPNIQSPSLDRLDFGRLRRLLGDLGLQAGHWTPGADEIRGFAPEVPICQRLCAAGGHCQPFLLQLARDAQAEPHLQCRSCMPGAFTVVARLDESSGSSPIVLGCFLTAAAADSPAVSGCLQSLQIDPADLLAGLRRQKGYGADDAAWLRSAFVRIAQEWYARSCDQAREVEALSQSLAETYEELSFIYRLNEAMNLTASPRAYLQEMTSELLDLLAAEAVLIGLAPDALPQAAAGTGCVSAGQLPLPAEQLLTCVDVARCAQRGYQVIGLAGDGRLAAEGQPAAMQMLCTPIVRSERQLGLIVALRAACRKFNNIDITRVSSIAKSAAMVLENYRLYDNLRQLFIGTLRALTRSIDAKDRYTCGHSERVALLAKRLLLQMGGTAQQAERVYLCGLLHDIGKIGMPESVLQKPGRPTDEEFEMIKRHPVVGAAILDGIAELEDIMPGVLHHHERVDGRGYPSGLLGEDIPLYARVLAAADTFDAMTSARPYRKALSVQVAIDEIKRYSGAQFDPAVVKAMLELDLEALLRELAAIQQGGPSLAAPREVAVTEAGQ